MSNPPKVLEKYKREEVKLHKNTSNTIKNKHKIIVNIKIKNATKEDIIKINNVLRKTSNDILKHINYIEVHNSDRIPTYITTKNALGTATVFGYGEYCYAHIDIISSKYYNCNMINSFENTLNHEIGHVAGATINNILYKSEDFANKYAEEHTIIKYSIYNYIWLIIFVILIILYLI